MENQINYLLGELYLPRYQTLLSLKLIYNNLFQYNFWFINPLNEYCVELKNQQQNMTVIALIRDLDVGFIKLSEYLEKANFVGKYAKNADGVELLILYQDNEITLAESDSSYIIMANEELFKEFTRSSNQIIEEIDKGKLIHSIYKHFFGNGRNR